VVPHGGGFLFVSSHGALDHLCHPCSRSGSWIFGGLFCAAATLGRLCLLRVKTRITLLEVGKSAFAGCGHNGRMRRVRPCTE
jgi:hypothetical protein